MGCQVDGSDVDDDAHHHLTGCHQRFFGPHPTYSYLEKRKTQPTTPIDASLLEWSN
jgi:hypothetical protein